ncbi:hpx-2 [Pristionchus pacificus]|nr:hpx-2 [Pristionchus pacificus]
MRAFLLFTSVLACALASREILPEDGTRKNWAATPTDILTAAMKKAISNIDLINMVAEDTIGEDQNPHTQKATADSIDAQKLGDIIQETTHILITENGADILNKFDGIDIMGVLNQLLGPKPSSRKKRQYGGSGGSTGSNGTITSSNPLDVSCIDRPATCDKSFPYRSISGWCNHDDTANRGWGSTMNPIRRFMGAAKYDDGFNSVRRKAANGGLLPSTRAVSNNIFAEASIPSFDPKYNHLLQQYGQWVAHDIIFTPSSVGTNGAALDCSQCESADLTSNCAPIPVPSDDAFFPTKAANGKPACIRLTRAINGQTGLGPRAQINQNSHFLDLSQVYGSTDCVAKELRTLKDGQMIMYTANGYLLPPRAANDSNCQSQKTTPQYLCFTAGDSRNSLHPGLIPMHTIYLRQHNKWASQIRQLRPTWSDNLVYHETRRLMIAMYQQHIYTEYLPKIIGQRKMAEFDLNPSGLKNTYDSRVNPSISAEFGTAAFRFGHSQARKDIPRMTNNNVSVGAYVDLGANIFYSDPLYDKTATVFNMAQGMVNSPAMAVDRQFSFPIRHELFATRGKKASGVDLPAVNVQRAREMGVQAYNEVRTKIPGLARVTSFDALKNDMDQANIDLLKKTYASVDDIDLYVGILLERPTDPTALLGPTGSTIIADQFSAFKKGDRFFYESTASSGGLTQAEYEALRNYPLAQLICENTDGMEQVQDDIFQHNARKIRCSSFPRFPVDQILY